MRVMKSDNDEGVPEIKKGLVKLEDKKLLM